MKIGKLGYLSFSMLLAGVVACGGDEGGGGDDGDDGGSDDGADGGGDDSDGADDDDGGTEPDAGDDGGGPDADPEACLGAVREVPNEGWLHVALNSEIVYASEPPASGNHYSTWATWDVHFELPRGHWVHNVEHGGIILLHRPDAPEEVVTALRAAYDAIPDDEECGHKRSLLAQDPLLTTPVAVIAADRVMDGACLDENSQQAILDFVTERRGLGPEDICDQGTVQ